MNVLAVPWVYPSGAIPDGVGSELVMVDATQARRLIIAALVLCRVALWFVTRPLQPSHQLNLAGVDPR